MICFLFIPVHWLFFAASTYVWVQYVWHTGKFKLPNIKNFKLLLLLISCCNVRCSHWDVISCFPYRKGYMLTNSISMASVCLYRGFHSPERIQSSYRHEASSISFGSLSAICSTLVRRIYSWIPNKCTHSLMISHIIFNVVRVMIYNVKWWNDNLIPRCRYR